MKKLILTISLTIGAGWASSQEAHLFVGSGTQLVNQASIIIYGSVEVQGAVINADQIDISRDFVVEGSYDGAGTLQHSGDGLSEIVCLDTINHFTLNKSSGVLLSAGNLIIRSSFNLTSGVLDLDGNTLRLGTQETLPSTSGGDNLNFVAGGSVVAHVPLPGQIRFAVGNSIGNPLTLDVSSISGTVSEVVLSADPLPHPDMPASTDFMEGHWMLSQSGITSIDCNLELEYEDSQIVGDESLLVPHYRDTELWTGPPGSGADIQAGSYSVDVSSNLISWIGLSNLGSVALFNAQSVCAGDFDNDGTINTADLLMLLGGFGCSALCPQDLNGDGITNTLDLLAFLAVFGSDCP